MSKTHWEVTALQAVPRDDGRGFDLWIGLDGPHGPRRIMVAPEALLEYSAFQREVLRRLGAIYRHVGCEGRTAEAANEVWRGFTSLIEWVPPPPSAESPPAPVAGEPIH